MGSVSTRCSLTALGKVILSCLIPSPKKVKGVALPSYFNSKFQSQKCLVVGNSVPTAEGKEVF